MPKHDNFHVGASEKERTRLTNLSVVRGGRCPFLFGRQEGHRHLLHDWAELSGERDMTLQLMLDEKVLVPGKGRYLGVNRGQAQLDDNGEHYSEVTGRGLAKWVHGDMETLLSDPQGVFQNVGVLYFDSYDSIGCHELVGDKFPLVDFAKTQTAKLGQFLLMFNLVVRGSSGLTVDKALREWREGLAHLMGVRSIPEECFYIYRNSSRGWRMVLVRLLFG